MKTSKHKKLVKQNRKEDVRNSNTALVTNATLVKLMIAYVVSSYTFTGYIHSPGGNNDHVTIER